MILARPHSTNFPSPQLSDSRLFSQQTTGRTNSRASIEAEYLWDMAFILSSGMLEACVAPTPPETVLQEVKKILRGIEQMVVIHGETV